MGNPMDIDALMDYLESDEVDKGSKFDAAVRFLDDERSGCYRERVLSKLYDIDYSFGVSAQYGRDHLT